MTFCKVHIPFPPFRLISWIWFYFASFSTFFNTDFYAFTINKFFKDHIIFSAISSYFLVYLSFYIFMFSTISPDFLVFLYFFFLFSNFLNIHFSPFHNKLHFLRIIYIFWTFRIISLFSFCFIFSNFFNIHYFTFYIKQHL